MNSEFVYKDIFLKVLSWIVVFGFVVLVFGKLILKDGSSFSTQTYLFLLFPSLLLFLFYGGMTNYRLLHLPVFLMLIAFLLWFSISSFWSDAGGDVVSKSFKYSVYVFLFSISLVYFKDLDKNLTALSIFTVFIVAVLCVREFYVSSFFQTFDFRSIRIKEFSGLGGFTHPIIFGNYLSTISLMAFSLLLHNDRKYWPVYLLLFMLLFAGMLLTGSRGPLISLLLTLAFSVLLYDKKIFFIALLGLFVVAGLVVFNTSNFDAFIREPNFAEFLDSFFNGRWTTWVGAIRLLENSPFLGFGADADFLVFNPATSFNAHHPHNGFLLVFYELGLIGLLLFLSLLIVTGSILYRSFFNCFSAKLGLLLLVYGVSAMLTDVHKVVSGPHIYWLIIWFPVAIALYLERTQQDILTVAK
ncbi:O-antigen ligase family protein [Endozoicomonas ascidiicola]|uniref:O-antigen ligase family protein n=1 Tax=Endozoicomonas ascidiicola TaxID=1698521 RepID=UPI000834A041|nr:O-antigen ligase family protein [Endozoicomonas ascidiicola]